MVLCVCCTFYRWAVCFELISELGDAAHSLSFGWRIPPCVAILRSAAMAGGFRKWSFLYTGCFGGSVCNAPDWTAHPGHRHSDASWGSTVDLCRFFKPDTNSARSPGLTFFQPKRKCSAHPMAVANHCNPCRKHRGLLCSTVDSAEKQADNTNHFIELAKKYTDFSELTPAMVNEFVSKIIVHRPFELNGTRAVQVEVYLNYIGKFDVPEEPMILSEEELATQKIREEKLEKHRIASRKYMAKYRKRLKEMKKAGTILPENLPAETKGEWL